MRKAFVLMLMGLCQALHATDLIQVYNDALKYDPLYHQALAQQFSTIQGVPIQLSTLLPNVGFTLTPYYANTVSTGSAVAVTTLPDGSSTIGTVESKGYGALLSASQPIFDFVKVNQYMVAKEVARQAQALINAAGQDLMIRVSKGYLALAADEENIRYVLALRAAYADQLKKIKEEHQDGYKSVIEVYTAEASYQKSQARLMDYKIQKMRDQEQLRIMTNRVYPSVLTLKEKIPLIKPAPLCVEDWMRITLAQNWRIKSAEYARRAALRQIKQKWGGHLPTLYWQNSYNQVHANNVGAADSPSTGTNAYNTVTSNLSLNVPIYQGGGVNAQVQKAKFDYEYASQTLKGERATALNLVRENYFGLIARIEKLQTDATWVKATAASLDGMLESYKLGTERLTNVLNQRESLQNAQTAFVSDRYLYVSHFLTLKQAAGLLRGKDLQLVNQWLNRRSC